LAADSISALELARSHARLGLITDGPAQSQWNKIRVLGIEDYFDVVVVTADIGASKPDRMAFEAVGAPSGASVAYVGDNPRKDFDTPRSMGWTVARVRRVGGLHFDATSQNVGVFDTALAATTWTVGELERDSDAARRGEQMH
ncbi:unnamed protein product, partial [marine sediment metagenome]